MKPATAQRWRVAQDHELDFWIKKLVKQRRVGEEITAYQRKAKEIATVMGEYLQLEHSAALQIGPGVIGEILFLPCPRKYAVDPLDLLPENQSSQNVASPGIRHERRSADEEEPVQ